tara:strand:- start:258 stop:902 length:645 start_codon:yes stop_codon:yes gene_type:complete
MAITLDGTTGLSSVDGSAASPSVRGSDSNSGIVYAADAIKFSTGGTQRAIIDNNGLSAAGHILQVIQTVKTDTTSQGSASSWNDISGMSVSITPISSSNKVLVIPDLAVGSGDLSSHHLIWRLLRGSTAIGVSTSATDGNLTGTAGMHRGANGANAYFFGCSKMFLDSPSTTSATTYKCQWSANDSGATLYLNRRGSDTSPGGISTITVMEVAA